MNGKAESYNLWIAQEGGHAMSVYTSTDEDLLDKYIRCRENKFSYFQWNNGVIPMRYLLGVTKQMK